MSGIDSLERRLELFIDGFARSKDGLAHETYAEALARAIVREFGAEISKPSQVEKALAGATP